MTRSQKQRKFSLMVSRLIQYIYDYEKLYYCSNPKCRYNVDKREHLSSHCPDCRSEIKISYTYEVALGHALRCKDCKVGKKKSFHKKCLAIDLNLFKNGVYMTATEDHAPFGEYWESIGGTWGGRFSDGNHYSYSE